MPKKNYPKDFRFTPTDAQIEKGLSVLKTVLLRMRWDDQGGFSSRSDGEWMFASAGLPQVSPDELDALMDAVGIIPDEIQSKGSCQECKHAINGHERGYVRPCLDCKRPLMSNFVPAKALAKRK